jgi:hypothetical protein
VSGPDLFGWIFLGGTGRPCFLYISHYSANLSKMRLPTEDGKPFDYRNLLVGAVGIELQPYVESA